jgi:hypothetical protein
MMASRGSNPRAFYRQCGDFQKAFQIDADRNAKKRNGRQINGRAFAILEPNDSR